MFIVVVLQIGQTDIFDARLDGFTHDDLNHRHACNVSAHSFYGKSLRAKKLLNSLSLGIFDPLRIAFIRESASFEDILSISSIVEVRFCILS